MIIIINILILAFGPFLMLGIINKTKAFLTGRKGAGIFQPLLDFIRLTNKDAVYGKTVSPVFKFAPVVFFASVVFAALFVPLSNGYAVVNVQFGFIIFAYILALGKFFQLLAALDTGNSLEGMGASREACFSLFTESAFFILMASISALSQNYTFESFKTILNSSGSCGILIIVLASAALFIMLLLEGSRAPVDNPDTHLELTMIHEAMILDNSGADLGLIIWSAAIKMFLFEALIANLIIPESLGTGWTVTAFLAIIFLIAVLIGIIEVSIARVRMTRVFEVIFIMLLAALLVLALAAYRIYGS